MKTKFKIFTDFCAAASLEQVLEAVFLGLMTLFLWLFVSIAGLTEDGNVTYLAAAVWGTLPAAAVTGCAAGLYLTGEQSRTQAFMSCVLPGLGILCLLLEACEGTRLPYRALQLLLALPAFVLGIVPAQAAEYCSQFTASLNLSAERVEFVYGLTGGLSAAAWSCFLMWLVSHGPALVRSIRAGLHAQAETETGPEALEMGSICTADTPHGQNTQAPNDTIRAAEASDTAEISPEE